MPIKPWDVFVCFCYIGAVIPTDPETTDTDDKLHFGYIILIVGGGSLLFGGTAAAVYYYRYWDGESLWTWNFTLKCI